MSTEPPAPDPNAASDRTILWTANGAAASTGRGPVELAAGAILLGRYRLIERLGSGAMGQVFRAEDLHLRQDIALKFLKSEVLFDPESRAMLLEEIRIARRVTHPNVCRVHDLGELDGQPFVSMEYVRGEDLHTLLRRIGRLHGEKATYMARQICAGVQAAHEQGILHRDLKPANVLVDHAGDAKITDFGIAAVGENSSEGGIAGSPAYMAPELFAGQGATIATDVYALGLVLYELYTGERLFRATTMTELLAAHRQPIAPPSQLVPTIDRQVEALILACLARNPNQRPQSALAVLAELPGTDLLAEALANGQTPTPALVAAAAGGRSRVSLRRAVALAVCAVLAFGFAAFVDPAVKFMSRMPLPLSDEILTDRAIEHLGALAPDITIRADAHGFVIHRRALEAIEATAPSNAEWTAALRREADPLVTFWYRASPTTDAMLASNVKGRTRWADPAHVDADMQRIELDPRGRLCRYERVPPLSNPARPPGADAPIDDAAIFARAGLRFGNFGATEPTRVPSTYADSRAAWLGPGTDGSPLRVEIARFAGDPVSILVLPAGATNPGLTDWLTDSTTVAASWRFPARVLLIVLAGAMAWSTVRRGRGDSTGAIRIGMTTFVLVTGFTVLIGDHGGSWSGVGTLAIRGMSHGLAVAVELAVYYLALEPHARRIWPESLVAWTRLLGGRFRDPLVAGSALVGVAVGCMTMAIEYFRFLIQRWFDAPEPRPLLGRDFELDVLSGTASAIGVVFEIVVDVTRQSMMIFVALVLLRLLLRREWLTAVVAACAWALVWGRDLYGDPTVNAVNWGLTMLTALIAMIAAMRFGLLALVSGFMTVGLLASFPVRPSVDTWYTSISLLPTLVLGLVVGGSVWTIAQSRVRFRTG